MWFSQLASQRSLHPPLPQTLLALPEGHTFNEIAKFWRNELNITTAPPLNLGAFNGCSLAWKQFSGIWTSGQMYCNTKRGKQPISR